MNRRFFLSALAASVAGAQFDPELALFVPGKKLISIPKAGKYAFYVDPATTITVTAYDVYALIGNESVWITNIPRDMVLTRISIKSASVSPDFKVSVTRQPPPLWLTSPEPI